MRHLRPGRGDLDLRVQQPGGPDHLLDDLAAGLLQLVRPGRGRDVDHLLDPRLPFLEPQRPVVQRAGQAEAVLDQRHLAVVVAGVHPADLRHGDVRLVDEQQEVVGKEAEQRVGRRARRPAGKRPAVVLDARAVAHLLQHLDVEPRAGAQPLGLQQLALVLELLQPLVQLLADLVDRRCDPLLGQHEVLGRIDEHPLLAFDHFAARGIDDRKLLDLVAPELDAEGELLVGRPDLDAVAAHAELARLKLDVVPLVLDVDQLGQHLVAVDRLADLQADHHRPVVLGRAQAVDARDAGHDDHVAAAHQRAGGGQPQPVDLLVDRGVLLDVDVALRDVGLGLVVVVVADEVVDRVVRKELLELAVELGGQRLVVRHDQRRPLHGLDHVGHRERLARAGHAHQHLFLFPGLQTGDQRLNGLRLIAGGLKRTD